MLVNGDGELLLRLLLADYVFIEKRFDLGGFGERWARGSRLLLGVVADNFYADINAFVADINSRAGDQLPDLILTFSTEAAS